MNSSQHPEAYLKLFYLFIFCKVDKLCAEKNLFQTCSVGKLRESVSVSLLNSQPRERIRLIYLLFFWCHS